MSDGFCNPYNFIRTPDRGANVLQDSFVGDHNPALPEYGEDHSRYWKDKYSGIIPVVLRTQTPVFITDPESRKKESEENEHFTYDTMNFIPASALKGVLSSSYEALTNSRYRVFARTQHDRKLGMRGSHDPKLIPGRVERQSDGSLKVRLFTGTEHYGKQGERQETQPQYAAWLPVYVNNGDRAKIIALKGKYVENVILRLYRHSVRRFKFWSVERIDGCDIKPITSRAEAVPDEKEIKASGYVVVTGKNFSRKHDERFFFNMGDEEVLLDVSEERKKDYEDLILDYWAVHEEGSNPPIGRIEQGLHIPRGPRPNREEIGLRDGVFVYVKMNESDKVNKNIEALFPVQISRVLGKVSPWECVHKTILPAAKMEELSPADRLFGWVSQGKGGAWKGKVRISDALFRENKDGVSIDRFSPNSVTLAIMGAPKPAQARFYLGDEKGEPQKNGIPREDSFYCKKGKMLRGRKAYLNHHVFKKNWDVKSISPTEALPEYISREKSNQNRSISSWIPPKKSFQFNMVVENLTAEELGALLTLLTLSSECSSALRCLKIGYGKPLGLGSITLALDLEEDDILPVYDGGEIASFYRSFQEQDQRGLNEKARGKLIEAYKKSVVLAYAGSSKQENPPCPPASWEKLDKVEGLFNEKEKKEFAKLWSKALEENEDTLSLESFSLYELFESESPETLDDLKKAYEEDIALYRKAVSFDVAWQKIPFVEDFLRSMDVFDRVHYPRNTPNDKGYEWFARNEKLEKGSVKYGYSLPKMGEELKTTGEGG